MLNIINETVKEPVGKGGKRQVKTKTRKGSGKKEVDYK